jgi:hypothetical protein
VLVEDEGSRARLEQGGRRLGGRGGDESRRRRCGRRCHVELGEAEVSADVVEGRERPLAGDELGHDLKALVEAAQNIQYQGVVLNRCAEVGESVSHAFHLVAVIVNGERALGGCGIRRRGAWRETRGC